MEDDIWGLGGWVRAAASTFQCNQSGESRHLAENLLQKDGVKDNFDPFQEAA